MEIEPGTEIEAFDPFADHDEIRYDLMARLRVETPVARVPSGFYYLARHGECLAAFRNAKTFANAGGMRLPGVVVPEEEKLINELDGERHHRLRRLIQSALTPAKVTAAEPYIRELAISLIEAAAAKPAAELVSEVAQPLPARVTAHMMGVPEDDFAAFRAWTDEVIGGTLPTLNENERGRGLDGAHPEFSAYLQDLIDERRASTDPPDDLVTAMLDNEVDGQRMSDLEIRCALFHLISAGNETTTNLIGNVLYELLRVPERLEALRRDRSLIPNAVEESLRHDAPVQMLTRACTRDVEIDDVTIAQGERIVVGIASANRDEAVYDDAESFRLDRPNASTHLTFGAGAHLCLGAGLARLEAAVFLEEFLDRVPAVRLDPSFRYDHIPAFWVCGPTSLTVLFS